MPDYIQILENIGNSISSAKIYESKKLTNKLFYIQIFYKFNNFQIF